jgi:hypothetical protein
MKNRVTSPKLAAGQEWADHLGGECEGRKGLVSMSNSKSKCTKTLYQIVLVEKYSASCHGLSIAKGPCKKRFMVFENRNESKG